MLPEAPGTEIIVDRAHRLPKPKFLPDQVPRDVIDRVHFFHIKDDLMRFSRKKHPLPLLLGYLSICRSLTAHHDGVQESVYHYQALTKPQDHLFFGFPYQVTDHQG